MSPFLSRNERFPLVGSTNDVVRTWLADGTPEVCIAIADEQSAGRGREGRTWTAPAGAALLLSLGFRPGWLPADRVWWLAAVASLAMARAAEEVAGLPLGMIRLKWPNDLVVESTGVRKLAGVLGETTDLDGADPRAVIGLGMNTDWAATDFPDDLATSMTSLRELSAGRPIDHDGLVRAFLGRLEAGIGALRAGAFDARDWTDRQISTGRMVDLVGRDGTTEAVDAIGVDTGTGALVLAGDRHVHVGEIRHVRVAAARVGVTT